MFDAPPLLELAGGFTGVFGEELAEILVVETDAMSGFLRCEPALLAWLGEQLPAFAEPRFVGGSISF